MECSEYGCIAGVYAKELCHKHYDIQRRENAPYCAVTNCFGGVHAKGLCPTHYRAMLRENADPCKVEGCGKPVVARDLCDAHRLREDHHGHLDPTRPQDWGSKSKHPLYNTWHEVRRYKGNVPYDEKWDDFWTFVKDAGDKPSSRHSLRRKDQSVGYFAHNIEWVEHKISAPSKAEYAKQWRRNNPRKARNSDLKKAYGITLDEYEQMLTDQNGKCAICGGDEPAVNPTTQKPRNLAVDHCHKTGKVRGLLCTKCNSIIGHADDDGEILKKAIRYLETFSLRVSA